MKKVVIEIGSNLGDDTRKLVEKYPDADFYCFEPTRELLSNNLWANFNDYPNVNFLPFAIDIENSFKTFNITGLADWGSSSLYEMVPNINELWHNSHPGLKKTHSYKVPTITLYDFCNLYNINQIDFLWIDAQGNDFNCLKSLKDKINIVKKGRVEADFSVVPYKNTNNHYNDINIWLIEKGFKTENFLDPFWPQQTNILFCKE